MTDFDQMMTEEVERLHAFFVTWFLGTADPSSLDVELVTKLSDDFVFVSPDGHRMGKEGLLDMFTKAHGNNPDFAIAIRNVIVTRDLGEVLVVTYEEWQRGAKSSSEPDNVRFSTALITKEAPHKWLHVHETWLPESVRAEGSFDF